MNATLTTPELTKADRCDRCGAAARVRAKLPSGAELLFCQQALPEAGDLLGGKHGPVACGAVRLAHQEAHGVGTKIYRRDSHLPISNNFGFRISDFGCEDRKSAIRNPQSEMLG